MAYEGSQIVLATAYALASEGRGGRSREAGQDWTSQTEHAGGVVCVSASERTAAAGAPLGVWRRLLREKPGAPTAVW